MGSLQIEGICCGEDIFHPYSSKTLLMYSVKLSLLKIGPPQSFQDPKGYGKNPGGDEMLTVPL